MQRNINRYKKEREKKDEKSKVAKEQSGSGERKQVPYYGSLRGEDVEDRVRTKEQ